MGRVKESVCVTGAGGFVASWLMKHLLASHYSVHATVRQPGDAKYAHLNELANLKLFKANLHDYDSLYQSIVGCAGVFHVASPVPPSAVPDPQVQLVEPAVRGTLNVLKACLQANVKRLVLVSSEVAVTMNPRWDRGRVKDETCWSDKEYRVTTNNWYCFSKTEAESQALAFAKTTGLDVVTVCPSICWGPLFSKPPSMLVA